MQFNSREFIVRSIGCGLSLIVLGTASASAIAHQPIPGYVKELSQPSELGQASNSRQLQSQISAVSYREIADTQEEAPVETYLMYVDRHSVYYRSEPVITEDTALGLLSKGQEVEVVSQEGNWCECIIDSEVVYIHADLLAEEYTAEEVVEVNSSVPESVDLVYTEDVALTQGLGRILGPSGEETYYNLNMRDVVQRMHDLGFEGEYWIREDGVKMFGEYVMVSANFDIRPLGTVLETSLGTGCVVDTGEFIYTNPTQIDIAVTWEN